MPPIPPHSTETSTRPWDGPANEARLRSGEDEDYYRRAYAWQDPDGDPTTKAAYRFIHHFVGGDGEPGAASTRACIAGIAILNGARGGTTIPQADRRGVWRHLARHLEDADLEPPALRALAAALAGIEMRSYPLQGLEIRQAAEGDDEMPIIEGYAAVFGQLSEPLLGFRERVQRGAFTKTIQEGDIRALWNHNSDYVLGRTRNGTLRLWEDERGLRVEIHPPRASWAADFLESIRRGDVDQMSFSFAAIRDSWDTEEGEIVRTLREVRLFDVSPVAYPAYPATSVGVRAAMAALGTDLAGIAWALRRAQAGDATAADRALIRSIVDGLAGLLGAPGGSPHPPEAEGEDADWQWRLDLRRKRLDLAERL